MERDLSRFLALRSFLSWLDLVLALEPVPVFPDVFGFLLELDLAAEAASCPEELVIRFFTPVHRLPVPFLGGGFVGIAAIASSVSGFVVISDGASSVLGRGGFWS